MDPLSPFMKIVHMCLHNSSIEVGFREPFSPLSPLLMSLYGWCHRCPHSKIPFLFFFFVEMMSVLDDFLCTRILFLSPLFHIRYLLFFVHYSSAIFQSSTRISAQSYYCYKCIVCWNDPVCSSKSQLACPPCHSPRRNTHGVLRSLS